MPITPYTVYHISLTAEVTVLAADEAAALALGKETLLAGGGDPSWAIEKEIIQVVTPAPPP